MTKRLSGGFDLRVRAGLQKADSRQVNQYLVPENRTPICADPSVWKRSDDVDDFMAKDTASYPLGLRDNLDDLVASLHERGITTTNLIPVCLTISEAKAAVFRKHFGANYFVNTPDEEHLLSHGWRFLGFDTVELNGLISGLKGIGYKEPTWSRLRAHFGGGH